MLNNGIQEYSEGQICGFHSSQIRDHLEECSLCHLNQRLSLILGTCCFTIDVGQMDKNTEVPLKSKSICFQS